MERVRPTRGRAASLVLGALAALALVPATASATTTVSYASATGVLIQGDAAGEGVELRLPSVNGFEVRALTFPTATLVAGTGCQKPAANLVTCTLVANRLVTANLGDGADVLRWTTARSADLFVNGGAGNDQLSAGRGTDFLDGGPGDDVLSPGDEIDDVPRNDVLEGGDGNDLFMGDLGGTDTMRGEGGNDTLKEANRTGPLADLFDGGPGGTDTADYSSRTQAVSLTTSAPDDVATFSDGASGEGDDLDNVETLIGGSAGDRLSVIGAGLPAASNITLTLRGNGGADTLQGPSALVRTSMDGGLGSDTVTGGSARDTIFSREGEFDAITCGGGIDTLTPDLRDVPISTSCENVNQGDRREGPNVTIRNRSVAVDADGRLAVRLFCPRSVAIGCRGVLAARLDRSGTRFGASERYSLRRGGSVVVEVRLRAGQDASARRRGARVRVRSVETGVHGLKTTLRSLPSRRG